MKSHSGLCVSIGVLFLLIMPSTMSIWGQELPPESADIVWPYGTWPYAADTQQTKTTNPPNLQTTQSMNAVVTSASRREESPAKTSSARRQLRVKTSPNLPELARRRDLSGEVRLQALVRKDGSVKEVQVLGGNPVLAEAVSVAVMTWKYEPGPQETVEQVEYEFK